METLNINRIRPNFQQAIVITNTLFPYVFLKRDDRIVFSPEATRQYIQSDMSKDGEIIWIGRCFCFRNFGAEAQ